MLYEKKTKRENRRGLTPSFYKQMAFAASLDKPQINDGLNSRTSTYVRDLTYNGPGTLYNLTKQFILIWTCWQITLLIRIDQIVKKGMMRNESPRIRLLYIYAWYKEMKKQDRCYFDITDSLTRLNTAVANLTALLNRFEFSGEQNRIETLWKKRFRNLWRTNKAPVDPAFRVEK